jgi:hypothetical protein
MTRGKLRDAVVLGPHDLLQLQEEEIALVGRRKAP